MPQCETRYFGTVSCEDGAAIEFPAGLPAFENRRRFLPMEVLDRRPFLFLQSLEEPGLCFITLPVALIDPAYQLKMGADDRAVIGLEPQTEVLCLAVVSITPDGIPTANLLAPIVVNSRNRRAVQSVRDDSAYLCRHPLAAEVTPCS